MTEELKPVNCGCGGEAVVRLGKLCPKYWVECSKCKISTIYEMKFSAAEAIKAWNKAMGKDNPVLTWDELKTMTGKPVWIECDGSGKWDIIADIYKDMFGFDKIAFSGEDVQGDIGRYAGV
jgi:hypothetical protein